MSSAQAAREGQTTESARTGAIHRSRESFPSAAVTAVNGTPTMLRQAALVAAADLVLVLQARRGKDLLAAMGKEQTQALILEVEAAERQLWGRTAPPLLVETAAMAFSQLLTE